MAVNFYGTYEHVLDTKGRLILPSTFRSSLGERVYVSQYLERCLALWTPEEFQRQAAEMLRRQNESRARRNLARVWAAGSAQLEVDRQGRVALPAPLRSFAHLDSRVLVTGAIDRVELWDPQDWNSRVKPAEDQMSADEASGDAVFDAFE